MYFSYIYENIDEYVQLIHIHFTCSSTTSKHKDFIPSTGKMMNDKVHNWSNGRDKIRP